MRLREDGKRASLRININRKKAKIMASGPITSCHIEGENVEVVTCFLLGSRITADSDCGQEIRR